MKMNNQLTNPNNDKLTLSFDPNTIEHLGVSLYSQLPNVLSELISNSWDADATEVIIQFNDANGKKSINYKDNGHGMTFDELNRKYLVIGRNKRQDGEDSSPKGRKPIGKKGLGKLSVFGICDEVTLISVKNEIKNKFTMELRAIKESSGKYHPKIIDKDIPTNENNHTEILLNTIRRKSKFDLQEIAISLAKKFTVFDQIRVILKNNEDEIEIKNELKFDSIDEEFSWFFPETDLTGVEYEYKKNIGGIIITSKTPIRTVDMRGIYLTSRGKIVNIAEFYGARDNDLFHTYITGYLSVDFIDEEAEDLISTDRQSLNWEHDITKELREYLQEVIKKVGSEWRKKRREEKSNEMKKDGLDVEHFLSGLKSHEKKLGEEILTPILTDANIDYGLAKKLTKSVIDKFDNEDFKEYANEIINLDMTDSSRVQLLKLLDDWKMVEAKQYAALATTRIEVIQKFQELLDNNTKEVPTLHNFLVQFPWLIDPRILEFEDEVRFSEILKENFQENHLDGKDRRIDFLCSNPLGNTIYIVEIKRSNYRIDEAAIEQAYDYQSFLGRYISSETPTNIVCYLVGGTISDDRKTTDKKITYARTGQVYVKTYNELLEQSKRYHKEFLDKYKELEKDNK